MNDREQKEARASATIHPFKPRNRPSEITDLHFAFRIDNYSQLARAFGGAAAHAAVREVIRVLSELLGDDGLVVPESDGLISASLWEPALLGGGPVDRACAHFIQDLSAAIARLPIGLEHDVLHVSLSGAWSPLNALDRSPAEAGGAVTALTRTNFPEEAVAADAEWVQRYRADMADAAILFEALVGERVFLAWQPVCSSFDGGAILYREALLRATAGDGGCVSPSRSVPALERLGLIRPLDHHVVGRAIDELENDPTVVLGANISAQSAVFDGWWFEIAERLRHRPDVARRLILEITETAQFPSISEATAFATRMRKLGCRIALDDFGVGHASIRQLLAFKPDIIKIDGFFLRRASLSQDNLAAFHHIVGFASALAPIVVVEGACTEALVDIARSAGSLWQQGCMHGGPTIVRTWLAAKNVSRVEALRQFQSCFERPAAPVARGVVAP